MQIVILRHGVAEQRELFAARNPDDRLRPLTSKGVERLRRGCKGLSTLLPELQLICTSPFTRAVQSSDILAQQYPGAERKALDELGSGGDLQALVNSLGQFPAESRVALVGHEPDLSDLVAWLCCGSRFGFMHLKKGAACLLECSGYPGQANALLHWMMPPRQLRKLTR